MTTLASSLNTTNRANMTTINNAIYITNNYDKPKVWYGVGTALLDVGIDGPSAAIGSPTAASGGFSNGVHLIRYRFKNSSTGYVSNPSPALSYTVTGGNGLLTFDIGTSGTDIIRSTDTKVDTILIEVTRVGGGVFYQSGTAANSASTVQVGMDDDTLSQQFNSDAAYGSADDLETYSAYPPPLCTIFIEHMGRAWALGDKPYALTDVTFTNGSAAIIGTGFSTNWAGKMILGAGDDQAYEILSVTDANNATLSVNYNGSTDTIDATVFSRFPNRGDYSGLFAYEQFQPGVWSRDFLAGFSDKLTAAYSRKDGMYVFGSSSAQRFVYNADPAATAGSVLMKIEGRRGCFQQRCLVEAEGRLFSWDRQGMWLVQEQPQNISEAIKSLLEEYVDFSEFEKFHAAYDPVNRCLMFFFVQEGDDQPRTAACMEIDTGRWFLDTFLQGITASGIVPTADGQVLLQLCDENGYTWYYGMNSTFDGVPATSPSIVTVTGSPTTTVFQVNETLPTTSPTLAGVMVYDPLTGEYSPITSNTADTITASIAFTSAPTVGQELYLGPIFIEYQTKWWVGNGQESIKNPVYFLLKLYPGTATGKAKLYFYSDFDTSPSTFTSAVADTYPDGVTITNGANYATIDLDGGDSDGVLSIPVPIEWKNTLKAKITSDRPDGDFRILDMAFVITRKGETTDVGV